MLQHKHRENGPIKAGGHLGHLFDRAPVDPTSLGVLDRAVADVNPVANEVVHTARQQFILDDRAHTGAQVQHAHRRAPRRGRRANSGSKQFDKTPLRDVPHRAPRVRWTARGSCVQDTLAQCNVHALGRSLFQPVSGSKSTTDGGFNHLALNRPVRAAGRHRPAS